LLNIVGEASPQRLTPHLLQAAHTKLPEAQLGLQPKIRKFGHRDTQAIEGLRLFGLPPRYVGHHRRGLELEAELSQTTTGAKSILLKAVDPLFQKHGKGAYIPIKKSGNKDHPVFKLDVGKVF
jgi:hypothetical protein